MIGGEAVGGHGGVGVVVRTAGVCSDVIGATVVSGCSSVVVACSVVTTSGCVVVVSSGCSAVVVGGSGACVVVGRGTVMSTEAV